MSAVRKKWYDGEIFTFPKAVRKFEQTSLNKAPTNVDQKEQLATSRGCLFKSADLSLTRVALSCVYLKIIGDLEWKS